MGQKHHKPEEIIAKLRQVEVLTGQGRSGLPPSGDPVGMLVQRLCRRQRPAPSDDSFGRRRPVAE